MVGIGDYAPVSIEPSFVSDIHIAYLRRSRIQYCRWHSRRDQPTQMALPAGRKPRLNARTSWRLWLFGHRWPFVGVFCRFDRNSMFWYSLFVFLFFSCRIFPTSQFHPTCLVEGCRLAKGNRIKNSKWAVCADRWERCRSPIQRTGWSGDGRKSRSACLPVCLLVPKR